MSNKNHLEEKPLYLKGMDDLAKDIFPMEKIIEWFTDYYGIENEEIVRERLKNPPILVPLDVKKFILAQALYRAKLSSVQNLDEFINNELTEASHFEHNGEFFNQLRTLSDSLDDNIKNLFLFSPKNDAASLQFSAEMMSQLGFDYEDLLQSLKSGKKSAEMKKFLSFIRGNETNTFSRIEENFADYFIKYYNFGVREKKNINMWSHPYSSGDKTLTTPSQFEQDLSSYGFGDLDACDPWGLTDEQKEIMADILSDERKFYNWSEEKVVAIVNQAFNTNHKTIEDILCDYDTEYLDCLTDRLLNYKYKNVDFYKIDENLTKEQKDNLSILLTSNVDLSNLDDVSEEYSDFIIETINDIFKSHYTTLEEISTDTRLTLFFRFSAGFTCGLKEIVSTAASKEKESSIQQYLEQSEQGKTRLEATNKATNLFSGYFNDAYACYNYKHACTMYRLEPFQISLGTIIHEFNHQMLYGSSYEENKKRFENIGKSLSDPGLGSPTVETINEFLSVRMMQSISTEDLKNYPFPISELDGCEYTPAVVHFWDQLIKLEETLKQCQLAGTYLPLEQKLGAEKLRAFDFAVRKFYKENRTSLSKKLDSHFEDNFKEELENNTLNL